MIFGNLGRFLKTQNADGEYVFNAPSVVQPSESSDQSSTERPFLVANHWSYCFFIAMVTVDFIVSGLMGFEVDCLLVRREQVPSIKETMPSLTSLASSQSLGQSTISQTSSFLRAAIKSGLPGTAKTKDTKQQPLVKPLQTTPPSGLATSDIVQTVLKEKNELIGHACQLHSILCTMLTEETDSQNLQLCVNLLAAYCFGLLFWLKSGGETPQGQGSHETVGAALFLLAEVLSKNKLSDFAVCLSVYDSLSTLIAVFPAKAPNGNRKNIYNAAFGFLENMLIRLPSLLINKDCLQSICEIIELGIYGCEGHQFNVSEKKPASQRVHDAADQLLRCMFSRVGDSFEPVTSPQDENYLIDSMVGNNANRTATIKFLYVLYNSFILAVSELDGLNGEKEGALELN
ncbi:hypothetical protein D918_07809 [Trichuris suis]|nr:hypothetical protein D918_07809 [Trichuris suis]